MALEIIILAAGQGTRMCSVHPKVMHKIAGKPMLQHVIEISETLHPEAIHVVVGHQAPLVKELITSLLIPTCPIDYIQQKEQLGTAHAVLQALPQVKAKNNIMVLYGDTPLTPPVVLQDLAISLKNNDLSVLSAFADDPYGYGRIIRSPDGKLKAIVEQKDATPEQKKIKEVNTGMIIAPARILKHYLPLITNHNVQNEYYLTDLAGLLAHDRRKIALLTAPDFNVLCGVNTRKQLAFAEHVCQIRNAEALMEGGVTIADPTRFAQRGILRCGKDVYIDINCIFEGTVEIADNVTIGAGCIIKDSTIAEGCEIAPYTIIEGADLKAGVTVGPFARIRPVTVLEDKVHIGNFVEVKNSHVGQGTKAGHLTYLGDSELGSKVNVGAGAITCNYDGANKNRTVIGNDVFIGSDTQFIAPVTVPDHVTIGAGTTYTARMQNNVKEGSLVITRAEERVFGNYLRPVKKDS